VDLGRRYIFNSKGEPIGSLRNEDMAKFYPLEKGSKNIDGEIHRDFKNTAKYFFPKW
jgi:hypothetical protein